MKEKEFCSIYFKVKDSARKRLFNKVKDADILNIITDYKSKYSLDIKEIDLQDVISSRFTFYCEKGSSLNIFYNFCKALGNSIHECRYEVR